MKKLHVSSRKASFFVSISIWLFGITGADAIEILVQRHFGGCEIGNMSTVSIRVAMPDDDVKLRIQFEKMQKQLQFLSSIFATTCENEKFRQLNDHLHRVIYQRVEFINNCNFAIQSHSQDTDLSKIIILLKKSSDSFVDIHNILTYGIVRDENANMFVAQHKDSMKDIGEILEATASSLHIAKEVLEGIAIGKTATKAMLKDVASKKTESIEENMAEESGVFSFLTKKIAEQLYNIYHQKSVPGFLRSVECKP